MKRYFFLAILITTTTLCFSQKVIVHASIIDKKANANSDTIYYDFNRPLTWNDFKGKPDPNHPGGAVTASGFAFNSQINSDGRTMYLNIQIYTFFGKKDSWKKPQIGSDYHLLHEQHHFDITRLGAEALVIAISKADFTAENYNSLLTSLFNKANRENSNLQQQYDRETVHSIDTAKQQEWNNKIADEVTKLKENTADKL